MVQCGPILKYSHFTLPYKLPNIGIGNTYLLEKKLGLNAELIMNKIPRQALV